MLSGILTYCKTNINGESHLQALKSAWNWMAPIPPQPLSG